ncbi:hypothetical protein [Tsukamurella tyrosinosolvens]|uniref:hypothetical protein n=1 Tax=Tsukamurella tyrosinosolvens TaxID=57704 RepID=UPI0007B24387|nr:hypothetical protein [Tsukamurella tyrosinosolvens]KZL97729.1 hypothetical protein AXX05_01940 [Tsukamurella tyrosinosolvens]
MSGFTIDGTVDLLGAMLADTPKLAGAACIGRAGLFDPQAPNEHRDDLAYRHRSAAEVCRTECPALAECSVWLDSFEGARAGRRGRPSGVLAGRIPQPGPTRGRPTKGRAA